MSAVLESGRAEPPIPDVAALISVDPAALSAAGRIDALIALDALKSWADAQQQRLFAAIAPPGDATPALIGSVPGHQQWAREEIALALRLPPVTVNQHLHVACELTGRLKSTLALLECGAITLRHASALVEAVTPLDDACSAEVEQRVLPRAPSQTVALFRRAVHRAVMSVDPRTTEERHHKAVEQRRICTRPAPDGMGEIWALLPADDHAALITEIDRRAALRTPGDARTADQRRADALVSLAMTPLAAHCPTCANYVHDDTDAATANATTATGAPATAEGTATADGAPTADRTATADGTSRAAGSSSAGKSTGAGRFTATATGVASWQGRRPCVQVSVALSTLLGLDEQPGDLEGYGPIPASLARRIAADPTGTWRRLVTDPTGRLLDYGRSTYRPPADLTDFVIARDRVSRFPNATYPARRSELDHLMPWTEGGPTNPDNLSALAPRAHHLKDQGNWTITGDPNHTLTWTTPTGHSYTSTPGTYPVDHTTAPPPGPAEQHPSPERWQEPDPPPF